jgi:hypothetical protein
MKTLFDCGLGLRQVHGLLLHWPEFKLSIVRLIALCEKYALTPWLEFSSVQYDA